MAESISLDEHVEFFREKAKLKLWFAWNWLREHPEETFEEVLRCRTGLWGLTEYGWHKGLATVEDYARGEWPALLALARALYDQTRYDADASRFEREAYTIFREAVERGAVATFGLPPRSEPRPFGALSYAPPVTAHPQRVHFHIVNMLQPASIFDDRAYIPGCFQRLMDDAQAKHGAEEIATGSWLNSLPRWQDIFPKEYLDHMGPPELDIRWSAGWWGQFTNARGAFNHKYARIFRETGRMPFPRRASWCRIAAMRDHLARRAQAFS